MNLRKSQSEPSEKNKGPSGMVGFTIVWAGQLVSLMGSSMTGFAIMIWLWQTTGKATPFALYGFFSSVPLIVASPLAGALVDRWDRKLTMMLSDLAAGMSSVIILILYSADTLEVWHLYATGALAGFFGAFQFPAFSAAITMMVSKNHYARASGMRSVAESASGIFGPLMGAGLLGILGLEGILVIDIITFCLAIGALLIIYIPNPPATKEGSEGAGSIWKESVYGFRYIYQRTALLGLLLVFLIINLTMTFGFSVWAPMILARTNDNKVVLGGAQSALAVGGLVSGLLLSVWGGPRRRIRGVFVTMAGMGLALSVMGVGRGLYVWGAAGFWLTFFGVIASGCSNAFWQSKVAPDVQGRVFAARAMMAWGARPLSMVVAGPLADNVFEPAMREGGILKGVFGNVVGTGPGSGMGLMFVLTGILCAVAAGVGYAFRSIRDAEHLLPDHEAATEPE
jgi:DHA3 family macrolide efflux protein-like MFS transporter